MRGDSSEEDIYAQANTSHRSSADDAFGEVFNDLSLSVKGHEEVARAPESSLEEDRVGRASNTEPSDRLCSLLQHDDGPGSGGISPARSGDDEGVAGPHVMTSHKSSRMTDVFMTHVVSDMRGDSSEEDIYA